MINFKVNLLEQNGKIATFELEPLEKGFGHTLGNCLRRVLLSQISGSAISTIKIDGVSHQFSTVKGISEDVIEIILNLKQVRIKLFSDKPARMTLKASGKGEVKARDIDTLGTGEIINPEQHIATLNSADAKFNMEMTVETGVGYITADEKKTDEIGVMPIDSIFTPVLAVDYRVEPTRVGRETNYDKLILNITTDGTVQPEEVLNQTAVILSNYFKQIHDPAPMEVVAPTGPTISEDSLNMSVEELDLPVRITNALKAVEIDTIGKLTSTPRAQLMKAKNLGVQSIHLISQKLSERGLTLSEA